MTNQPPPSSTSAAIPSSTAPSASSDWGGERGEKWRAQMDGMEAMLAPVNDPLVRALRLDAPLRIADIGCGGGATAFEIARRAPAGSVVRGFDISPSLVEAAGERAARDEHIAFAVADMTTASPPEPFDRLVSRFGIMFFADAHAAFANIARWLAPRGRFAFAAWGRTVDNPWMSTVRDVVGEFVEIPSVDPEAPGPFRYGDANKLIPLLQRAGFVEVEVDDWRGSLPIGGELGPAESANFALAAFSTFGELLAKAGESAFDGARRSLTERFTRHQKDGAIRLDACVHIFTGMQSSRNG